MLGLLRRAGATPANAASAIDALAKKWNPRDLRAGQKIGLQFDNAGLRELRLVPDPRHDLILRRVGDGHFAATLKARALVRVPVRVAGRVASTLSAAASAAGMPRAVLGKFIDVFRDQVDFRREIQPGDRFVVMYNRLIDQKTGKPVGVGDLSYASLALGDRVLRLFRFAPPDARAHFYTAAGRSVKKALLRRPIHGARLTSPFGMRIDPVLKIRALHTGIDLAAPMGTPVFAAGNGVVATVGWEKGYGRLVVLRHKDGYSTAYAHLSRFAKGVRPGVRVKQGRVIGYVGNTGYSTGPHLLYEIRIDNRPVNPQTVKLPPAHELKGAARAAFKQRKDAVEAQLAALRANGEDEFAAN